MILDNEKAAKLFSQSGYDAVPEEVFPVKLERVVFRYADGRSYMLQECDSLHRKVFVPEPKYAIGLKKSPILEVCER